MHQHLAHILMCKGIYRCAGINIKLYFSPTLDKKKLADGYVCEILHYLLKDRIGTSLVKLSVDLADMDNKAALELLSALFEHCECHENFGAY